MSAPPSPQATAVLSLIGLLPPELRGAALLTTLRNEVHRRAGRACDLDLVTQRGQ